MILYIFPRGTEQQVNGEVEFPGQSKDQVGIAACKCGCEVVGGGGGGVCVLTPERHEGERCHVKYCPVEAGGMIVQYYYSYYYYYHYYHYHH